MQQSFFSRSSPYNKYLSDGTYMYKTANGYNTIQYLYPLQKIEVQKIQEESQQDLQNTIENELETRNIEEQFESKTQGSGGRRIRSIRAPFRFNNPKKTASGSVCKKGGKYC